MNPDTNAEEFLVNKLPADFKGMRHNRCYHCDTTAHVKSGGCWTVRQAVNRYFKEGHVIVIGNRP